MTLDAQLLIDGAWCGDGADEVRDPATHACVGRVPRGGAGSWDSASASARRAPTSAGSGADSGAESAASCWAAARVSAWVC